MRAARCSSVWRSHVHQRPSRVHSAQSLASVPFSLRRGQWPNFRSHPARDTRANACADHLLACAELLRRFVHARLHLTCRKGPICGSRTVLHVQMSPRHSASCKPTTSKRISPYYRCKVLPHALFGAGSLGNLLNVAPAFFRCKCTCDLLIKAKQPLPGHTSGLTKSLVRQVRARAHTFCRR